jgi:putative PIN family toxin of toxin-antitoxin system
VKVVLDTNVLVSGILFSGPPHQILQAWSQGRVQLAMTSEMLEEAFPGVDIGAVLDLILVGSEFFEPAPLGGPICSDPDDDKFLACAVASKSKVVISGDRHLLRVCGYGGVTVMKPRDFVEQYLSP